MLNVAGPSSEPRSPTADQAEHLRLSNILDQMPVGIGIFDSLGRLFHSNRHFEHAAGGAIASLDAMAGEHWSAVVDDGAGLEETAYPGARALRGDVATPGTNFIRKTSDGRDHWVSVSAVPLTTSNAANVVGVVMVVENAEDQRRSMERLRAKDECFRRFARYSSNALWIADGATGRMDYLSPAAASIWSGFGDEHRLDHLCAIVHPDDRARVRQQRRDVAGGQMRRFDYRIVNARGDVVRNVRETSFPIPGDDVTEDCVGGIVEDISPERQIYFIGPCEAERDLLGGLRLPAHRLKSFSDRADLIRVADVLHPGCVIVDLRHAPHDPAAITMLLANRPADLSIVFVGAADTPVHQVMDAMRGGAVDYIVEPVDPAALERAIGNALGALQSRPEPAASPSAEAEMAQRFAHLPRREREVFEGLLAGGTNKTIARQLGISPRTVEVHRAHLMERLNVRSLSQLLQLAHRS